MKKIFVCLICVAVFSMSASGSAYKKPAKQKISDQPEVVEIQVFSGTKTTQPFVLIGKIHAKASTEKMLISKIKSIARKNGADAVIDYKLEMGTHPSYWTGAVLNNASGIAVRWAQPGENGMLQLPEDVVVPVIQ